MMDTALYTDKIFYEITAATCFLCNHKFQEGEEPWLMFEKRMDENGELLNALCDIVANVIGKTITESDSHSSVLCDQCNTSLLEYEALEMELNKIRNAFQAVYNNTMQHYFVAINENQEGAEVVQRAYKTAEGNLNGNCFGISAIPQSSEEVVDDEFENLIQEVKCEDAGQMDSMPSIKSNESYLAENAESVEPNDINLNDYDNETTAEIMQSIAADKITDFEVYNPAISVDYRPISHMSNEEPPALATEHEEVYKKVGDNFICLTCNDNEQLDAADFVEHMRIIHQHTFINCTHCPNSFVRRQDLAEHMLSDHTVKADYKCWTCNGHFRNSRTLRLHKRTHCINSSSNSNNKQYECKVCHKKYSSKNLLDEHLNIHTGQRPFKCSKCSKGFTSKYTLQSHMKIHTERQRPYQCDQCDKSFLNQQNLNQHQKLHTGIKPIACSVCGKSFSTQHNLNLHMIVHTDARPYVCKTCGKSFARRPEIKDHERIHSGERPFKCDMCPMAFTQRSNLNSHKKSTHYNEKLHTCQRCDRSFKRRRLLDYHIQAVHTGERPHKCNICGATFVYPEHYKKHMIIHSGDKPFSCEICGKQFNSRDNRNAHRFVHSDKKPYECMECGAGFMRKPILLAHMQQARHNSDQIIINQPQFNRATSKLLMSTSAVASTFENGNATANDVEEESQNNLDLDHFIIEVVSDEHEENLREIGTPSHVSYINSPVTSVAELEDENEQQRDQSVLKDKLEYLDLTEYDNDDDEFYRM